MAAAECVQIVDSRAVIGLISRLDAAFRHHGIGVANPQLGDNHRLRAGVVSLDGSRGAGAAAADDQHIHVVIHMA